MPGWKLRSPGLSVNFTVSPISKTSRREFVAAAALLGASSLVRGGVELVPVSTAQAPSGSAWSSDARKEAAHQLLAYFGATAPQLLRSAEGILVHPSIACSLPGKAYATNLWDWDTYWTTRGLFRFAALSNDPALRKKVGEYAIGSFMNFFDHQSDEGRLSIMLDVKSADAFGTLKKDSIISRYVLGVRPLARGPLW